MADVDQAIDNDLGVGAAIRGVDAVAGFEISKRLERGIIMAEGLDEDGFEFPSFGCSQESCADPAVVGAEAATGGFGGGMENPHVIGGGEFTDEVLVLLDGEPGIPHVRGVDEEFEIIAPKFFVDGLDESGTALDVGEGFEFTWAEKFDVPGGDVGI